MMLLTMILGNPLSKDDNIYFNLYLHRNICFQCKGGKVQQMLAGIQSSDEGQQLQSVIENVPGMIQEV